MLYFLLYFAGYVLSFKQIFKELVQGTYSFSHEGRIRKDDIFESLIGAAIIALGWPIALLFFFVIPAGTKWAQELLDEKNADAPPPRTPIRQSKRL